MAADAPNFISAMHDFDTQQKLRLSPSVAAFHEAFRVKNKDIMGRDPKAPVNLLDLELPEGYRWSGYWEVKFRHPKGVDPAGWRYALFFESPDHQPALFKKTRTPNCMVRRRTWTRMVKLENDETSTEASPLAISRQTNETAVELYLKEKQDEMIFTERIKKDRQEALECGKEWSQEEEIAAGEALRSFIRKSRSQLQKDAYSRLINTSLDNPFQEVSTATDTQPYDSCAEPLKYLIEPNASGMEIMLPGQSHDLVGRRSENDISNPHNEMSTTQSVRGPSNLRPDGADMVSGILSFTHDESVFQGDVDGGSGQLPGCKIPIEVPTATVSAFVLASPTEKDSQSYNSPHVIEGTEDFDHVFSKFVNNPENNY
ncbi:unnamed protein product [Phytomonas sp. EM1]|nr:unnamed protein product [Phytomonas sp. EM1]|eukprot:CCW62750.1 unnamed protein product [Phytomonas sp. isolate EM1]